MKGETTKLASELKKESGVLDKKNYTEIKGMKLGFPYIDISPSISYYNSFDPGVPSEVWESREAMSEIFTPENIPRMWIPFLKKVEDVRHRKGSDTPMDLVIAAYFVCGENPERIREIKMKPFEDLPDGGPDLTNKEEVIKRVDIMIKDPILSKAIEQSLIYQIPDIGSGWLDDDPLVEVLKKLSETGKRMLDIGCGTGSGAFRYASEHSVNTVAVDRQYHARWYNEHWKAKQEGLNFVRCDASDNLPFKADSVDFALLRFVVPHVTTDGLNKILNNTLEVLKPHGILMVGPEDYEIDSPWEDDDHWRYYEKNSSSTDPFYKRITHSEALTILSNKN